ncbi:MAG TPA: polysaccharide biosynthesis tyrosine autokinase [Gemmatimonadales bacterium]|nr:polysaccharide biosynthesis tyrosine autokinase [Gemmatimonadales bacterium]
MRVLAMHWKIVGVVTVVAVVAAYTSARRAVPRYRSDASFQVGSKKYGATRLEEPQVNELDIKTDPVLSEALFLKTQNLALAVADSLGLQLRLLDGRIGRANVLDNVRVALAAPNDTFALVLKGPAGYEVQDARGRVLDAGSYAVPVVDTVHGFRFVVRPADVTRTIRFAIVAPVTASGEVRGGMGFDVQSGTTVVGAWYEGEDPSLAPDVLNQALEILRWNGVARLRQTAAQREDFLKSSLDEAGGQYRQALAALQQYKETQHATDLSAEEQALLNSLQLFEREKQERREDLALLQGILGPTSDGNVTLDVLNRLAAMPDIDKNTAIAFQMQNLLKLYDDRRSLTAGTLGLREDNPSVQALDQRIQQAGRALRQAAQATEQSLQADVAAVDARIADLRGQLAAYPGKETRIGQLELDASLYNDTYRYLLTQLQAAQISSATISPYVDIVETATVASRIGIGTRQKVTIGLLIGLFLGVVSAFFLEYLDQTIKSSADIERALEVPVLGLIPVDPRGGHDRRNGRRHGAIPLITRAAPDDPTSEAYRALRTNVTFVRAEQRGLQVICVTSPGPGEGKSTTAANLAITLAQQGAHTLLADADLRRPLVHRAFNLVQEPGLTDILVGTATLREAVRPNVIGGLDVLPGGALPPNPSELLGSEAMHRLLAELRTQYDYVIFDTPPALAVTDATVLGAGADAVIIVLRAGETEEVAAQRTVELFRRVQARVAGTVLNGVEKARDRYYYYDYGHPAGPPGRLAALRGKLGV